MAAELEKELEELHLCLEDTSQTGNARAHDIIDNIAHICLEDANDKDIDYCCALLFSNDHGVIVFLKKVVLQDEYQNCKATLLEMLLTFVVKYDKKVLSYSVDIKEACMSLFLRDRFAKVKNSALPVLIEVIKLTSGSSMADELKINKMVEKFFTELTHNSKYTASVKQHIYHLLGVLAEVYPELMINYGDRLVDMYVKTIKTQMTSKTKKPELCLIAGCLQGLTHLLVQFTQSADEGAKHSYDIYKYTCKAIAKDVQVTRYEMSRSGLELLTKHASQFNQYLLDDYEEMYERLSFWSSHHNRDMLHLGTSAMDSFFKQISSQLVSLAKEGRKEGSVFTYFVKKFQAIMDSPDSSSKEISLAIRGYGYFAAPCKLFMSEEDVKFMFTTMIQRSEQMFLGQTDNLDDKVIGLPNFLTALASIIAELDEISDTFLLSLEKLIVILMENFPKLSKKLHFMCFLSVLKVCFSLAPKGAVFKGFLARLVYQGLLRTCSHPVVMETENPDADEEEVILENRQQTVSYKDYVEMWKVLLNSANVKELAILDISLKQRQVFTEAVYDEIITSVLQIVDRLDLTCAQPGQDENEAGTSSHDNEEEDVTSDPIRGLQAARPKDFVIFINLVAFSRELLPTTHTHLFKKWIFALGHDLILHSTKYPLVSGFYKLLGVCVTIAGTTKYFKGVAAGDVEDSDGSLMSEIKQDSQDMEVDDPDNGMLTHKEACYMLFIKFTKEVLVRLKQYKDELLASCLFFILSLPREIVITELPSIVPAIQLALQIGRSYIPLANMGLDALESWSKTLPDSVISPHYRDILQYLDPYLKSGTDSSTNAKGSNQAMALTSLKPSRRSGKKKIPIRLLKQKIKGMSKESPESQLAQVRQRCVLILGSLGGSVNNVLVTSSAEELSKAAVAWDNVKHLKFDMPFVDIKPVIYFDPFLPRVVELATTSSERQTKVAACELLHSLVLYTLGRSSQQPGAHDATQGENMENIYKKLFPALMQLACDVEQVSRQLFEPLVMQLIHWFTSGKMYNSKETKLILATVMDGLVSPTDTALRDFCAKCVHEFLHWSIKQATKKQMEKCPYNMEMLVTKVYSLARHPSAFKRLGAALAFNNIYTIFREEETLVDVFTFEILTVFIESLAVAHQDDKSLGTQEQTKKVLSHLKKIIVKKSELLGKPSEKRKTPKDWSQPTLHVCVRWLLRQCGRPQTECRHACMELVCSLTNAIPGVKKPGDFLIALDQSSPGYFIQRFEFGRHNSKCRQGIGKRPMMQNMADMFTLKTALSWYDMLLCTLDCYTWVFSSGLLTPGKTLVVSTDKKGTILFKVLHYFFDELAQSEIETAAKLFDKSQTDIFTPRERDDYNRAKCTVIVRVMYFIVTLLKNHRNDSLKVIPGTFWSDSLWSTMAACILTPSSVGFNMANVEILDNLPQQTQQLLTILTRYLPDNILKSFTSTLPDLVNKRPSTTLLKTLPINLDDTTLNYLQLSQLIRGYQQLHTAGLLVPALGRSKKAEPVAVDLLDTVFRGLVADVDGQPSVVTLTPTSTDLASDLLRLAFLLGLSNEELLSRILDKSPIQNMASHSTSAHGAMFYAYFKSTINCHLVANSDAFLDDLMNHVTSDYGIVGYVLTGMIEQIGRDRQLRKKCGTSMVKALLSQWYKLRDWWDGPNVTKDKQTTALGLLSKLILIDSKAVCDEKTTGFDQVYDMYLNMLASKNTSLAFKSHVLDLLAFFCVLPDGYIRKLKRSLDRFVDNNFPQCSTEYAVGSPKYNDYITALNKILSALELSGSLVLLEILISIMCKEEKHVHEDEIQNVIARFIRRLPMDKQKPALDVAYDIFHREGGFTNSQRRAALERVCLSMLRVVTLPALKEFFMAHIKDIVSNIEMKFNKHNESVFETQLMSKLCNFELVEVMYSRLTKEEVRSKNSVINQKYCSPKTDVDGKEMTLIVTKAAHAAKAEDVRGETVLLTMRRQYHCAAYNALIAIVSCTQTDVRFYKGFLFTEDSDKKEFLWENLVDQNREYTFPIEMETPLSRRRRFVAIRQEHRSGERDDDSDVSSIRYLASQYLADSSLGADISQFDFTASLQASAFGSGSSSSANASFRRRGSLAPNEPVIDVLDTDVTVRGDYLEMEMDELNQHLCMAPLVALLRHMDQNDITPKVTKGEMPSALPQWMSNILKKLQHPHTPRNTRLFLVKLMINTEEVFRPYARFWLAPLVQVITRGDLGTEGINYFITDVVVTLLSWHTVAIPEDNTVDRSMASRLLEVLMKQCHYDTKPVLKNNLEILKTLVEVWKTRIEVPTIVLYDNFTDRDMKSKRNMTGIQMAGLVLANHLSPYTPGCGVDKDKFYRYLAMNMQNMNKVVYTSSAEVVGIALKYMTDTEHGDENVEWHTQYQDNVSHMLLGFQESKPDRFICCVHRMQLHFPAIADRLLSKILFLLPKVYGEFKTQCLEIIQNRISAIDNAFVELKNKDIIGILTHRDELTQHTALRLVKGLCTKLARPRSPEKTLHNDLPIQEPGGRCSELQPKDLLYLLSSVTAFATHPSAPCRTVMYDILMWIYDNYRDEDTDDANAIICNTKEALLLGLSDDDLKNRLTVQNFWSDESRLPGGTLDRLVAMLKAMYSPGSERQYLGYATNLLLEMTSKSPDYNRQIFEHPLSSCKFEKYDVKHSWKQRHAGMTPLFADTQTTQAGDSPSEGDTILSTQLRATQDVQQFTATQDPGTGSKAPYNWLTQSSLDTFSDSNMTISTETPSSLLFTVGTGGPGPSRAARRPIVNRASYTAGPGFGTNRLGSNKDAQAGNKDNSQSSEIMRLKRRFIKDSKAKQAYFAKKEARLKKLREEVQREQLQKRENQVTMYRKYRIGDLPDVQIDYSSVIAPLQALAQKDSIVAGLLFSSIFKAIYAEIDNVKTERESVELSNEICSSLNNMLSMSTQYYPPFINCAIDMAYCNTHKLHLDPSAINTACVASLQQPIGIILLETMLIHTDPPAERPNKRSRTVGAQVSRDITSWLELARLYKSIGDYDVLKGIFGSQLGTQKITSEAMEAEMSGDYQTAVQLYKTALQRTDWDEAPNEVEIDLWDASRLQCYEHLTQWNNLHKCTVSSIDESQPPNLDKVWEDTYLQETYLPYLLRSKLKLLLEQGDGQDDLGCFIDQAMKIPERKAMLESVYSEELALLYIWQEEYDRATYHTNHAMQLFLQDWSSLDCLMSSSRTEHLRTLQKLTEMNEFLDFIRKESNLHSPLPANQLVGKWLGRSPDKIMDPSGIWDDVISNRILYLGHIAQRIETADKMEVDGDDGLFDRHKVVLRLAQAESSRQQDNFPVAMKQMKNILTNLVKNVSDESLRIECYHTYTRIHHRKCQVAPLSVADKLSTLTGTVDSLKKFDNNSVLATNLRLKRNQYLLQGQAILNITTVIQEAGSDLDSLPAQNRDKIRTIAKCTKDQYDEIVNSLIEEGYNQTKMAVSVTTEERNGHSDMEGINAAYMALVNYCDKYLRQREDDEHCRVDPASMDNFSSAVIMSLLAAMHNNSKEARQRFPRLLQLVEIYPDTMNIFIKKASTVPTWMYLSWISQITALLDKPESPAIQDILLRIAKQYPEALIYPFKMSCDGYQFNNDTQGKKALTVCNRLKEELSCKKEIEALITALEQFGQPNAIFKDWFQDTELMQLMSQSRKNEARIKAIYQEMYQQLVEADKDESLYDTSTQTQANIHVGMGPYRTKFSKAYRRDIEQKFGRDGSRLLTYTLSQFLNHAKTILNKMNSGGLATNIPEEMKDYSEWLNEFQACSKDNEIEIPGQYAGQCKPLPEYHTKIACFEATVKVMSSLRKPKKIVMFGNDQKEYPFLVKGGEDLRLDQRIEQLFTLMNQVFTWDAKCRQRRLQLRTYQVIPMTTRVGLIEWMSGTTPLKDFLYETFTDKEKEFISSTKGPKADYASFLKTPRLNEPQAYLDTYKKFTRSDIITSFKNRENLIPWDLSRRAYQNMAASPEAFFTLKSNFAISHGQLSICQYMLGIGDRHLSNFMVDQQNGKMVGIDFGHAFGSATQFLPVPELMPFRLTRQMRNLMMPLREKGLMESTMIHTLRALRNHSELILNTMDIFIKEPSLDWKQFAARQIKTMHLSSDTPELTTDQEWYPRQKVAYARRKFEGHNPASITRDELKLGHSKNAYYSKASQVILGDKECDIRARLPPKGLTVEEQVACLINQATDPHILGRVYFGWEPWM